jgi:DUF3011 family protein
MGATLGLLLIPLLMTAQYPEAGTVTCASTNGQRTFCTADTHGGVRLVRQFGQERCDEGSTWGFTEQGIWVDRGCRAEFLLANTERSTFDRNGARGAYDRRGRLTQLLPGTVVTVRTNETVDVDRSDGRVFTGVVDQDVRDTNGRVAIPRGSAVELTTREMTNNQLALDLESVMVNGRRYAIRANSERVRGTQGTLGLNSRTGEYVGGGALLGTILGAVVGGGKGAAIGAAAGAAAGAGGELLTSGNVVKVPGNSLLTFRLEQPLDIGVTDNGFSRDGYHYHPRGY